MNYYRYLPQNPTFSNPDGLPVGMVKDNYKDKDYMGFTCAACHTGQINYKGRALRIDGAPAMADMNSFMVDLGKALLATQQDADKKQRFINAVLERNGWMRMLSGGRNYTDAKAVEKDLEKYTNRLISYNTINHPDSTKYGYARLDAFGRIYNRVLEHVLTKKNLSQALKSVVDEKRAEEVLAKLNQGIIKNDQFDHLLAQLSQHLSKRELIKLRNQIFIKANAPVSYPFLWDIAQSDYVQWNGIGNNAGLGPLGRNTGEVLGVFGTLDWSQQPKGFAISSLLIGKNADDVVTKYDSSVNTHNLRLIEDQLHKLQSPQWPAVFPKIDTESAKRGEKIYDKLCLSCHAKIDRSDPKRRVIADFTKLDSIGTDKQMATNATSYTGYSGITQGLSVPTTVGKLYVEEKAPVAAVLTMATAGVIATPDADKGYIRRFSEWVYNLVAAYRSNPIKPGIKRGDYDFDTTVNPFASLNAYKGRPLNGIWATAPYLHNGSVPTLYDLLLEKRPKGVTGGEYRPDKFSVGYREFDPVKVGFVNHPEAEAKYIFDTRKRANDNAGHDYGTAQMSKQQRMDLVEYLKTL